LVRIRVDTERISGIRDPGIEQNYFGNQPLKPWPFKRAGCLTETRRHSWASFNWNIAMLKTRLYVECPNRHVQYLMKDFDLTYSNGAYIENVAGSTEWQCLICPCRPPEPYKFKLKEQTRLHVFQESESERTHFSLKPVKAMNGLPPSKS
jgi:hypothetical protein